MNHRLLAIATLVILTGVFLVAANTSSASASTGGYCGTSSKGWTMTAGRFTSCALARSTYRSVRSYQRWNGSIGYGDRFGVDAWSPVKRRWYSMRCRVGYSAPTVVCVGGNRARATFRY